MIIVGLPEGITVKHEFKLGDTVMLNVDTHTSIPFTHCTVQSVNVDGTVDLFRPFVHHGDFSHAWENPGDSAVSCYLGFEQIRRVNPEHIRLVYRSKYTNIR